MTTRLERITTLAQARTWVWTRLVRRAGSVSGVSLRAMWASDPRLLDDALTSLRNEGRIRYIHKQWHIREWAQPSLLDSK